MSVVHGFRAQNSWARAASAAIPPAVLVCRFARRLFRHLNAPLARNLPRNLGERLYKRVFVAFAPHHRYGQAIDAVNEAMDQIALPEPCDVGVAEHESAALPAARAEPRLLHAANPRDD